MTSYYLGTLVIRFRDVSNETTWGAIGGLIFIVFGITLALVFAGMCFQIMDIRNFTRHAACALRGPPQRPD